MKNEEKAKDMTKCIWYPQKLTEDYIQKMLIEMAEWKEKKLIDKACEWLKDTLMSDEGGFPITSNGVKEFIKDFKQAMEE